MAVGAGVGGIDDRREAAVEDPPRLRVVGQGVGRLKRAPPVEREVAQRDEPVAGPIPVAQGTVVGADGPGDVAGDPVADELGVHRPREVVRHRDDAPEVLGRRRHPPADFEHRDQQQAEGDHQRDQAEGAQEVGRDLVADRDDLGGEDGPDADEPGDDQDAADFASGEERQRHDGRQQRGDRHRGGDRRLEDRGGADDDQGDIGDPGHRACAFRGAEVARLGFEPAGVANRHRAERERAQVRERDAQQCVRHTDDQRTDGDGANEQLELPLTRVGTRFGGQRVALGEVGWGGDRHRR